MVLGMGNVLDKYKYLKYNWPKKKTHDHYSFHCVGLKRKPITGHILELDAKRIKIATQWYRKEDMTEETLMHFNPREAAKKEKKLREKFTIILKRDRGIYKSTIIYDIKEKNYKASGYIRIHDNWVPKKKYLRLLLIMDVFNLVLEHPKNPYVLVS